MNQIYKRKSCANFLRKNFVKHFEKNIYPKFPILFFQMLVQLEMYSSEGKEQTRLVRTNHKGPSVQVILWNLLNGWKFSFWEYSMVCWPVISY